MQAPLRGIEFFGLPGSGKTTVARELLRLLQEAGVDASFSGDGMSDGAPMARRMLRRLEMVAAQSPRDAGSYWRGARLIAAHGKGLGDSAHSLWNLISVQAMAGRHLRGHGLMVLDQGLVQAVWSARMREKRDDGDDGWSALLNDDWLGQCCFVQVGCKAETAMERLGNRKQRTSRMQRPDRLQELAEWSRGEALVTELSGMIEGMLRRKSLANRLIRIRTDDGSGASVQAVMLLESLLQAGGAPAAKNGPFNAPETSATMIE
jgi:hypothetical protein